MAREHCGIELADLVRVVHTTHGGMSDAFALVKLRMAVLQEAIHLVVVDVLEKPPLIWEHNFKHDVCVLRLKSLHGVDLADACDSVVHVVDCLLDHGFGHPLDSVRWRLHEAGSHKVLAQLNFSINEMIKTLGERDDLLLDELCQ